MTAMECDEVMLTVRITTAELTLLRRLALGHRSDVSEVVTDALLDILPTVLDPVGAHRLVARSARPAPCALTVWLPAAPADLLLPAGVRIAQLTGVRPASSCAVLGAALRLWLAQDPRRLAAGLGVMHEVRPVALAAG
ncbi:hypothetical protein [Kitasatospora sp. NPDC088346]|uniref:hypothetical protein n=1 Tax=Kitasatospora sp. NPDC088346 TaxID=3364073 RepID=UPI0037F45AB2